MNKRKKYFFIALAGLITGMIISALVRNFIL